ncbi:radical SAM protein [Patescibacteria group bacterium]|nr:radical SAM protein [Patescibacteria group bacterium]MBU1970685.1 radical SAM protein [Patescibacteria group bacterium]
MVLKINEIKAKSILTKSGLPGADWVINPYNGCLFGCMYCYAAQIARWKHPEEEWGTYLDVKINAPELFKRELAKLEKRLKSKDFGSIFFSSVTDPYVGLEAKYQLTRKCLQALADFGYGGSVTVQTKSPLVTRDIDVLKRLKNISVGFTITSLDDRISAFLEVKAPLVSQRLVALKKLHDGGISTYAFVGPILPHFLINRETIKQLLNALQAAGVNEVWFEHLNLNSRIKERLYTYLNKEAPEMVTVFEKADTSNNRISLDRFIVDETNARKMRLGLGKVILHSRSL